MYTWLKSSEGRHMAGLGHGLVFVVLMRQKGHGWIQSIAEVLK